MDVFPIQLCQCPGVRAQLALSAAVTSEQAGPMAPAVWRGEEVICVHGLLNLIKRLWGAEMNYLGEAMGSQTEKKGSVVQP